MSIPDPPNPPVSPFTPRTESQKNASRAIALDDGLHARSDDLLAHFRIEFAPAACVEHCFVEHMVVAQ